MRCPLENSRSMSRAVRQGFGRIAPPIAFLEDLYAGVAHQGVESSVFNRTVNVFHAIDTFLTTGARGHRLLACQIRKFLSEARNVGSNRYRQRYLKARNGRRVTRRLFVPDASPLKTSRERPKPAITAAPAPNVRFWRKASMVCAMDRLSAAEPTARREMPTPLQSPAFQKQA